MHLADRRFQRRFARFNLAAGAVDLAGAETSLLADQQDPSLVANKEEGRSDLRLPRVPVDLVEVHHSLQLTWPLSPRLLRVAARMRAPKTQNGPSHPATRWGGAIPLLSARPFCAVRALKSTNSAYSYTLPPTITTKHVQELIRLTATPTPEAARRVARQTPPATPSGPSSPFSVPIKKLAARVPLSLDALEGTGYMPGVPGGE